MIRRVELTADFHTWPTAGDWEIWARRCGLDPEDTAVPGWIECDDDARTVTALTIFRAPAPEYLVRNAFMVQLESRALPFPAVGL